ncbi:MAG: triacylglycerol lipase [Acinetobacter populi]|jgi:triacylglycerol lipase|uniref:esterase/lipase family protein n=1 Tax=Acinetobacter populi TaxID=1582270 RepID=UPI002353FD27|nr:triacylglycerol lipase [Acinetobacter populi]MCH4247926.1 triacylglycerol lipase [Acinetobacter populi]
MKHQFLTALSVIALAAGCITSQAQASNTAQYKSSFVISNYAQTKYPLVFAHGMAGFNRVGTDLLGLDYWYQIIPDLARNGANVWTTRVSPFNSTEIRGEQLLQQVDEIIAITGQPKVNLIGHSHGGPTIRYVAGVAPEKVASLTAVAGPHKGSGTADLIVSAEGTIVEGPLVSVINLFSQMVLFAQTLNPNTFPSDALSAGKSLTTAGSNTFNSKFPIGIPSTACGDGAAQEKGIYLYSFTGVKPFTNILDPIDYALQITSLTTSKDANDGLVSRCSAKFGKTIRDDYAWNHLDEVNQVLGIRGLFAPDPVSIYRQHANRLKLQGL